MNPRRLTSARDHERGLSTVGNRERDRDGVEGRQPAGLAETAIAAAVMAAGALVWLAKAVAPAAATLSSAAARAVALC
jgi:hypothetical protein